MYLILDCEWLHARVEMACCAFIDSRDRCSAFFLAEGPDCPLILVLLITSADVDGTLVKSFFVFENEFVQLTYSRLL